MSRPGDEYQKRFERVGVVDILSPGRAIFVAKRQRPIRARIAVYQRREAAAPTKGTGHEK